MISSTDRVFILGSTGNIGSRVVQDLVTNNIPVTLYARSSSKVEYLYPDHKELVKVVQGDYDNLTPLKAGIQGHSRLFLLVVDLKRFIDKTEIAKIAYEAGVKQIVDVSSFTANMGWRTSYIGAQHGGAEEAIYRLANRGYFVALRPGFFMSNALHNDRPLATGGKIFNVIPADHPINWISTNDIGAVAAVVLSEDVDKHNDAVYTLTSDLTTFNGYAEILTRVLGQEITYYQIAPAQKYKKLMELGFMSHLIAVDLCAAVVIMMLSYHF